MSKQKYPSTEEAEKERGKKSYSDDDPDFVCGAPNYDKFEGWTPEQVLAWLNIY